MEQEKKAKQKRGILTNPHGDLVNVKINSKGVITSSIRDIDMAKRPNQYKGR